MFEKMKSLKSLAPSTEMETVIGTDTVVQGTLSSKGTVRVYGKVEGGITECTNVLVGEGGEIEGDINCHSAEIGGKVIGNITAGSTIEILSNAELHGDVKTHGLSIAEGATFEGNCTMTKAEKQVIEMDVSVAQAKIRR